ncbi:MAG: O-antigen ligase family protein [Bacteroidota bacterium]
MMPDRSQLIFAACCLLLVSLVYSPFLLSVSMILLMILSLIDWKVGEGMSLNPLMLSSFQRIRRQPSFLVIPLFFIVVLLSFWQTENWAYWLERLRIKLPFLLLPFVFLALPRFKDRQLQGLFYVLMIMLTLTGIGTVTNYWFNMEEIQKNLRQGHSMPTPRNHLRLSLLLAYGIIAGVYLYWKDFYWRYRLERKLILGMVLFLLFFLHFLSVKTGLLTFYAAVFVLLIRYLYLSGNYWRGGLILLSMCLLPYLAYRTVPSLNAKIGYTLHDLDMYFQGKGVAYADSGRLISLAVGWDIFKRHPFFGVGAGNLRTEVHRIFEAEYPNHPAPIEPHNEFLFVLAGTGLFGFGLFCLAFFYPLWHRRYYRQGLFLAFYVIMFIWNMIEHGLESSVGVALFIFFVLLWLNVLHDEEGIALPKTKTIW